MENTPQIFISVSTRGLALLLLINAYSLEGERLLRFASSFMLIPDSPHNDLILFTMKDNVSEVSISNLRLSSDNDAVVVIRNQRGGSP